MHAEKLKRITTAITRSLDTWMGMRPITNGEATRRSKKANGFVIIREIDTSLGTSKTTIDHATGRLDVTMSFAPLSMDRWVRVRVGTTVNVGFERSRTFTKGTHMKTIQSWIEEQLSEGLRYYE